jgi:hypothetical protein
MAGPAAAVLSSVHYQAQIVLSCGGILCSGTFPPVAAKRRLNVTRMTCLMQGTAGSTFSFAAVQLRNASNGFVLDQLLPSAYSSSDGIHTLNQAIDMQVIAGRRVAIALILATGTASAGRCTATGTLDTLQ